MPESLKTCNIQDRTLCAWQRAVRRPLLLDSDVQSRAEDRWLQVTKLGRLGAFVTGGDKKKQLEGKTGLDLH